MHNHCMIVFIFIAMRTSPLNFSISLIGHDGKYNHDTCNQQVIMSGINNHKDFAPSIVIILKIVFDNIAKNDHPSLPLSKGRSQILQYFATFQTPRPGHVLPCPTRMAMVVPNSCIQPTWSCAALSYPVNDRRQCVS